MSPGNAARGTAERSAAALRVLREYTRFARGTATPCAHLADIQAAALAWLQRKPAPPPQRRVLDADFVRKLKQARDFTTVDSEALAQQVLQSVAGLAVDAASADQVRASAACGVCRARSVYEHVLKMLAMTYVGGAASACASAG